MGESTCLMQPFSYASGIPNDTYEGNPIHALGQSVSFGRFVSESVAWDKWSTISHNRHVEEAERYSRPGSVAQKKAFFEAHYKKIAAQRAAAVLEQASANANAAAALENAAETKSESRDRRTRISTSEVFVDEQREEKEEGKVYEPNREEECFGKYTNDYNANTEMEKFESSKVHPVDHEDQVLVENSAEVELSSRSADNNKEVNEMELTGKPQIEKPLLKQSYSSNQEASTPVKTKKTRPFISSKSSLTYHKAPKVPSSPTKSTAPSCSRKDDITTPLRKYPAAELEDKKKSTPKSIHKSFRFTPIRELSRLTSTVIRKIENSRAGASSSKTSKDCPTALRTPTKVSKNEVRQHSTTTPCSEKRRAKTPLDPSASGTKTPVSKWRSLRTESSKKSLMRMRNKRCRRKENSRRKKKKRLESTVKRFASRPGHFLISTKTENHQRRRYRRFQLLLSQRIQSQLRAQRLDLLVELQSRALAKEGITEPQLVLSFHDPLRLLARINLQIFSLDNLNLKTSFCWSRSEKYRSCSKLRATFR